MYKLINKFMNFLNYFFHLVYLFHKNRIVRFLNNQNVNIYNVFDVGAYRGKFGNSFNKSRVFFFESNPFSFKKMKKIKKNKNKYFNVGIGSKYEERNFYIMPNDSASTFHKINNKSRLRDKIINFIGLMPIKKKVEIFPLNYFIKKYQIKNIDILKIDTEGYEEEVLKGVNYKNFKKIKYIVIEKHTNKNLYKDYSFKKIEKILTKNNFYLIKKFKDYLWNYEDLIFKNKNFNL